LTGSTSPLPGDPRHGPLQQLLLVPLGKLFPHTADTTPQSKPIHSQRSFPQTHHMMTPPTPFFGTYHSSYNFILTNALRLFVLWLRPQSSALHTCSVRPAALSPRVSSDRCNEILVSRAQTRTQTPYPVGNSLPSPLWCCVMVPSQLPASKSECSSWPSLYQHRLNIDWHWPIKRASGQTGHPVPRFILSRFIHLGLLSCSELIYVLYKQFRIAVRHCVVTLLVHLTCVQHILSALPYATATDGTPTLL